MWLQTVVRLLTPDSTGGLSTRYNSTANSMG